MNYEKLYFAFIEKYQNQVFDEGTYTEVHHIIPRHAGGDDSKENLIRLDYKQHTFAHHLLWKAYNNIGDKLAFTFMSNVDIDKQKFIRIEVGKMVGARHRDFMIDLGNSQGPIQGKLNVESGLLDKIRPLANNQVQRRKASDLCKERHASGYMSDVIKAGNDAWRGSNHTEEWKEAKALQMTQWASENKEHIKEMVVKSVIYKKEKSKAFSDSVILNAERNEEFLQEISSRSKNKFISPEGLEFDSPIFAAKYYGNVDDFVIENWCKRNHHGWSRKPKAA